jgi:hypothetical protein
MGKHKMKFRIALIVVVAVSVVVCPLSWGGWGLGVTEAQVSFVPSIVPLEITQTLRIEEVVATLLVSSQYVDLERGAFFSPTYQRVPCGDIDDDVCYEICYAGTCYVYGDDDGRVTRFVQEVDDREEYIQQLESARRAADAGLWDTIGTCVEFLGGGLGVGAVLVAIDVTGILKAAAVIGAIAAVAGGGAICGGSIAGRDAADEDRQQVEQNIIVASRDAIYEFQDLERNPPE